MGKPHTALTTWIRNFFLKEGVLYRHYYSGGYGSTGIPDIYGCYKAFHFEIEVKVPPDKPSQLQEHELKQVQLHLGYSFVAYGREDFIEKWKEIKKRIDDDFYVLHPEVSNQ
jgi:hypothetical protein